MRIRLLLLPALLLLVLAGCVEKNTGTAELSTEDYTMALPANWHPLALEKMPASSANALTEIGLQALGVYTGAPSDGFRLPLLIISRKDMGKLSYSEILLAKDNIKQVFAKSDLEVSDKHYDGEARRLTVDAALTTKQNLRLKVLATFYFTEKGELVAFGYVAPADSRAQAELHAIMKSVVLSPELQYQPIVTK
jgi:hypothetical protein